MKSLFKYISYLFTTFFIITLGSMLFVLYSPKVFDWVADQVASKYHFSYTDISGSLLTGLSVVDLRFKDALLLDRLEVTWDPAPLLNNTISLHTLTLDGLCINSSQNMFEFFNTSKEKNTTFPFDVTLETLNLHIKEFNENGIGFNSITAQGKELQYYGHEINVNDLTLNLDSNVSQLSLKLQAQDKVLKVEYLKVLDIDTIALQEAIKQMIAVNLFQEIEEEIDPEIEKQRAGIKNILPKSIQVDNAIFTVQPYKFPRLDLQKSTLNLNGFFIDIYKIIDGDRKTMQVSDFSLLVDSNISTFKQKGSIKNSQLYSSGSFTFPDALMKTYHLPIKENAVEDVMVTIEADEEEALITLDIKANDLLQKNEKNFTVSHLNLHHILKYTLSKKSLQIHSTGDIGSTYTKALHIDNNLTLINGSVQYNGEITPGELTGLDDNYTQLLDDLKFAYKGLNRKVDLSMDSKHFKGLLSTNDFKELNATMSLISDFANIDANITHDNFLKISTKTTFPKDSLLREQLKQIRFDAISPLQTTFSVHQNTLDIKIDSQNVSANLTYDSNNSDLKGDVALGSVKIKVKGNVKKKLTLSSDVKSLQTLFLQSNKIFAFDPPALDGDAKFSLLLDQMKKVTLTVDSKNLLLEKNGKMESILKDTKLSLEYENSLLTLNKYHTTFEQQKLFSNKPSQIVFKDDVLEISPFWINDSLKVTGKYDLKHKKGALFATADRLSVSHEKTSLISRVDIKSTLNDKRTSVKGSVTILGGNIYYDLDTKRFDNDNDIVMVQKKKKSTENPFYTLLETEIKVKTQKALIYKNKEANINATADLLITKKPKGPLNIEGDLNILAGSTYTFKGHTIVLKESLIHFTGNPKQPTLDVAAIYKSPRALITIQITGSPASPHYIFSSTPHMNKQEILSMLLFDSLDEGEKHSEEEMSKLMRTSMGNSHFSNVGGAVAKSVFSSIGMNIDHLPFIGSSHQAKRNQKKLASLLSFGNENTIKRVPIHFYGQKHFDEETLAKAMGVYRGKSYQFWKKEKASIKESLIPTLKTSLRNFYDSEGYYNAKITIKQTQKDVRVKIDEKSAVKINTIGIESDYDIKESITFEKGSRFTSKEFVTVKTKIIDTMMREGYCNYTLDTKAYVDRYKHKVDITIDLQQGDICTFGKVTVKGLTNIKDDIVLSRVRAKEGEHFNDEKITKSYDALYALDAFDSIYIDTAHQKNSVVPLEITGSEITQPWYVKGGIGWEGDTGLRLTSEVIRTNLFGDAKQLSFELVYSSIDKLARFSYFAPARFKFLNYYLDLTTQIAYNKFDYTYFSEDKIYARSYVSYNGEHLKLHAGLILENIEISPFSLTNNTIEAGDKSYQLITPRLQFTYDKRDEASDPKNGYYVSGSVEYALPYEEKASSFLKYELEGIAIITFFDVLTLSAVGKVGAISDIENTIPASKLFFAGGIDSNRAYGYKRMGVTLSPTEFGELGGSTMANLSLEANYPLTENLYGAVFSDNTSLNIDSFNLSGEIISSAGIGLRYVTPIGPIKVDFGMNIEDSSQNTLHFQLGQSF